MEVRLTCLHTLCLSLLLLSLQDIPGTVGRQLSCSYVPSNPVTLGFVNSTLTCNYTAASGETLIRLEMNVRPPNSNPTHIFTVNFLREPVLGFENNTMATDYSRRIHYDTTFSRTTVALAEILCKDEVEFLPTLFFVQNNIQGSIPSNVNVTVQAPALPAQELTVTPTGPVTEHSLMTFTCVANVGVRPRGTIRWEVFENNTPRDVTSQSSITSRVPGATASCTEVQTSFLSLNVTRRENNAVIRCVVERPGQEPPSFYNQTARLDVLYGVLDSDVAVSAQPAQPSFVVGDSVTLRCSATANPPPSFTWTREGSNWTQAGAAVTLDSLQLEDVGRYVCEATNNVSGTLHMGRKTYQLVVTEVPLTTTPAPTSPPTTDPVTGPGASTAPTTQGASVNVGLIVGLVLGGVALIAIIVIVVICCRNRRNKKEIEEPSEKPYNNRQNINSISAQPDLVNDKQYSPYKNDDLSPYIDDKPRSRRPVDFGSSTYDQTYMPQV